MPGGGCGFFLGGGGGGEGEGASAPGLVVGGGAGFFLGGGGEGLGVFGGGEGWAFGGAGLMDGAGAGAPFFGFATDGNGADNASIAKSRTAFIHAELFIRIRILISVSPTAGWVSCGCVLQALRLFPSSRLLLPLFLLFPRSFIVRMKQIPLNLSDQLPHSHGSETTSLAPDLLAGLTTAADRVGAGQGDLPADRQCGISASHSLWLILGGSSPRLAAAASACRGPLYGSDPCDHEPSGCSSPDVVLSQKCRRIPCHSTMQMRL